MNDLFNRPACAAASRRSLSTMIGIISLSMAVTPAAFAKPAGQTYAAAIQTIQAQLRANELSAAETALARLDRRFPRNPEIASMRIRLACQRQDFVAGRNVGSAVPRTQDVRDALAFCHTEEQYAQAQKSMTQGAPAQAIATLLTLMQQDKEGYRAGRLLASAYLANAQPDEAEALYRQLARRYPADAADLMQQAERLQDDRAVLAPQASLAAGDLAAAIASAKTLYDAGRDRYRTGLLLAKAYSDNRQFDAAASVYDALTQQYPNDQDLRQLAQQAREQHIFATTKTLLDNGDSAAAIAYLEPLYPTLAERYQAGLMLNQAYRATGQKSKAADMSAMLARDYPSDPSLAPAAVTAALADAQYAAANDGYAALTQPQRLQVLTELGGNGDRLSRRSIAVFGAVGSSDNNRGEDGLGGIRLKLASAIGTATVSAARVRRFGQDANDFGLGFSTSLGNRTSADVGYTRSTGANFLARQSITLALSHSLATVDLYGSVRHLIYSNKVADVLYAGIGKPLTANTSMRAGLFYVPQSGAYSVLGGLDWIDANGDKTFATVTAGRAGEQTGFSDSIVRSASYSIVLGRLLNFANQMSLLGSMNYEHRAGLFNRLSMSLELIKGW